MERGECGVVAMVVVRMQGEEVAGSLVTAIALEERWSRAARMRKVGTARQGKPSSLIALLGQSCIQENWGSESYGQCNGVEDKRCVEGCVNGSLKV